MIMKRFASAALFLAAPSIIAHAPVLAQAETALVETGGVGTEYMVFDTGIEGEAHEQFLRGLALLHNFEYSRAAAAFRESQAADPDFVMAYWGEAMTHNHPLWEEQDRDAARAILEKLAPTREGRMAKTRSPREAAWLDAVETLYGDGGTKEERDHLYLAKMRALLESDPDDIDARAFTGLAILGTSHGGRQVPLYMEAAGVLEPGFMTHEMHPGILHYLIHSYDDPVHAPLGERMAERYAVVAPDAGHAQHMISHIYHALANWEASEKANVLADAVVDRQRAAQGQGPTDCGHYNEWLVYALLQQGKDASDIVSRCRVQAEAQIADGAANRFGFGASSSYAVIATWQGVDTGSWPDMLTGTGDGFILARMLMAHGKALEAFGAGTDIAPALSELKMLASDFGALLPGIAPDDRTSMSWLERAIAQVEALQVLSEGDTDRGLAMLEAAAEAEAALPVAFGPPRIAKPSYELQGEQLLAQGRNEEAAEAFRKSLEFAPGRRSSRMGLNEARSGG
jgi:tetratricopeptide (TPR) repeat protein